MSNIAKFIVAIIALILNILWWLQYGFTFVLMCQLIFNLVKTCYYWYYF